MSAQTVPDQSVCDVQFCPHSSTFLPQVLLFQVSVIRSLTNTGHCSPTGGRSLVPWAGVSEDKPRTYIPVRPPLRHIPALIHSTRPRASRAQLQARLIRILAVWHPALPSCPPSVPLTAVQVTRWLPPWSYASFCLQAGSGAPITCCLQERGSSN